MPGAVSSAVGGTCPTCGQELSDDSESGTEKLKKEFARNPVPELRAGKTAEELRAHDLSVPRGASDTAFSKFYRATTGR